MTKINPTNDSAISVLPLHKKQHYNCCSEENFVRKHVLSLRTCIAIFVVLVIVLSTMVAWALMFSSANNAVGDLVQTLRLATANSTVRNVIRESFVDNAKNAYTGAISVMSVNFNMTTLNKGFFQDVNQRRLLLSVLSSQVLRSKGSLTQITLQFADGSCFSTAKFKDTFVTFDTINYSNFNASKKHHTPEAFDKFLNQQTQLPEYFFSEYIKFNSTGKDTFIDAMSSPYDVNMFPVRSHQVFFVPVLTITYKMYDNMKKFIGLMVLNLWQEYLQDLLVQINTAKRGFILVTDQLGVIVASSFNLTLTDFNLPCVSNNTEVVAMCKSITNWAALNQLDRSEFSYHSPLHGSMYVTAEKVTVGRRSLFAFVVVSTSEYYEGITNSSLMCLGISLGIAAIVSIAVVIGTTIFSIKLHRIAECFKSIREVNLDSSVIRSTMKSSEQFYELRQLLQSFKSMYVTLNSFQRYVPVEVVRSLVTNGVEAKLGLDLREASILFLDIKDFTTHSERLTSYKLVEVMTDAFDGFSIIIAKNFGTVDKYIGDCVMALWNTLTPIANHQICAVTSALECIEYLDSMKENWEQRGLPALKCRVGIASGTVLAGNFGSTERFSYSAVGDIVNTAARVEPLNNIYKSAILVTEEVASAICQTILTVPADTIKVKGKEQPTTVHNVLQFKANNDTLIDKQVELYKQGFKLFQQGAFLEAEQIWSQVDLGARHAAFMQMKCNQCLQFAASPPANWTGVIKMDAK